MRAARRPQAAVGLDAVDFLAERAMGSGRRIGLVVGCLAGGEQRVVGYGRLRREAQDPPEGGTVFEDDRRPGRRASGVVPQMADQPSFAGRVAELGIGTAHDGPTPTTESLSAALRTTLTPETRARAAAVAGTTRGDGATVAATLLLDAASRERPAMSA
jgi:hypothetical protein